jgi:para-nitrobenzyl esterase
MAKKMVRQISGMAAMMALLGCLQQPALAQPATQSPRDAITDLPPENGTHITVTTQSWEDGSDIPLLDTQFGDNAFPGLIWSRGPEGTKSYVIVIQDSDASQNGEPVLHLTLYNIPDDATRLHVGMVPEGNPRGSSYGPNYMGNAQPYLGPHPPPGPKHHYHFQVFALDTALPANPLITYGGLVSAMHGHVLASGEVVGLSEANPPTNVPPAKTNAAPQVSQAHRHEY